MHALALLSGGHNTVCQVYILKLQASHIYIKQWNKLWKIGFLLLVAKEVVVCCGRPTCIKYQYKNINQYIVLLLVTKLLQLGSTKKNIAATVHHVLLFSMF